MTLLTLYKERIKQNNFEDDASQRHAISLLEPIKQALEERANKKWWHFLQGMNLKPIKGLYLYGGVGRGKSFVMDLFFETLELKKKQRLHFHEFMRMVHEYSHTNRDRIRLDQALPEFAKEFSKNVRVLCFDEFHVTDIADAMILGRLFEHLWENGVVVIATSNWAPENLYKDGLQRDLFLPFIQLLKGKMVVYNLDSGIDYRLEKIKRDDFYCCPDDLNGTQKMDEMFAIMVDGHDVTSRTIIVKGHNFFIPVQSDHRIARFDYRDIIEKEYAALDFLELAQAYEVVMIDHVPQWKKEQKNEVKRFMILVDALYDNKTQLILSAAKPMTELYEEGPLKFEFERTISRLQEMQSVDYIEQIYEAHA